MEFNEILGRARQIKRWGFGRDSRKEIFNGIGQIESISQPGAIREQMINFYLQSCSLSTYGVGFNQLDDHSAAARIARLKGYLP